MLFNRLRQERERLGLSQTAVADLCKVTGRTQRNYETGARAPDTDYLVIVAGLGMDVMYILTGQRNAPVAPGLSRRAAALVDNYEHTDEAGKKIIEGTANLAAQSTIRKRA